jgi:hypothetical protein
MKQLTCSLTKLIGALAGIMLLAQNSNAQTLNDIQSSFDNYRQYALQEKVFVHTDKASYMTGEILWFKVYIVDGTLNKPLGLSKVAYIEILDNAQNPVIQTRVAMRNGLGSGSVYIPVTLNCGNYKLRAYTNWMKNFSPDYYFEKTITVVNPVIAAVSSAKQTTSDYDIQFFPEGGNLVAGLPAKVAFKAVDRQGKGADVYGEVMDQKKDTIAKFKSLKFGMGSFTFTPNAGDTYKVTIHTASGIETRDLPAINPKGYVMQLINEGPDQLKVTVNTNVNSTDQYVYLFAHTRQVVKVAKAGYLNNGTATITINTRELGDGISHITIFDGEKRPVCERLYFKRPSRLLNIEASADKGQYGERKKVEVALSAKDYTGKLQDANLSMSVYRLDPFQTLDPGDIASYFWLSSDLRGNIESPEYYLKNNTAEANEAADNLMLTQGWRRFKWDDVLKNKQASFTFLPELNGHLISGKIVNTETNKPAKDIIAYLGVPGKKVQLFTAISDSTGRLLFNTKDIYGPGEIVVQTNTEHDSTYRVDILSPYSEQYSKIPIPPFSLTADMQKPLERQNLGMQVLNIYSGAEIRKFYKPDVDSVGFFGRPYKTYMLDDYTRFTTMEEVLREYIREVNVVRSSKRYHIKVISSTGFLDDDPLVMLDGIPIFNIDKVIALDPLKIKRLDVMRERYFYGPADAEGILSYTTYKGDLGGVELDPHAVVVDYEGMQLQRVFYSPVYDSDKAAASRIPDFRNVLYWSPNVNVLRDTRQVSFYTADEEGEYIGVIQGITPDGQVGSQYFKFKVKR